MIRAITVPALILLVAVSASTAGRAAAAESRSISGVVYIDRNLNGQRDADERGAPDRTVEIEDSQGMTLDARTASDGRYHFANLPADGDYTIHVLTDEKAPCADSSWRPLLPEDDWSNIDIAASEADGEITGTIVNDVNENGRRDVGETGEAGWSVLLQGGPQEGSISCNATVASSTDGSFRFRGLPAGSYFLMIDDLPEGSPPTLWEYTYPTQSDGTYPQLRTVLLGVELPAGARSAYYEFGVHELRGQGTISVDTFIDKNANEVRDPGEPLAECWRSGGIDLYRSIPGTGLVPLMVAWNPDCNEGVSSLAGLPAGTYGIWYPWWCSDPEQAGPPSNPDVPTMAIVELAPGGNVLYEHGKCASDWVEVETSTPMPPATATPSLQTTVTAPDVGESVDGDSNGLSAAAPLALLGATMACGAGFFGMRKRHRKA